MSATRTINLEEALNNCQPAAARVKLGTLLKDLIDGHNALCAKLDADAGVTDTDYADTLAIGDLDSRDA